MTTNIWQGLKIQTFQLLIVSMPQRKGQAVNLRKCSGTVLTSVSNVGKPREQISMGMAELS